MPPFKVPCQATFLALRCDILVPEGVIIMKNNYEQHRHTTELVYSCCTYGVKN